MSKGTRKRLWAGLISIGLIWAITLGIELQSAVHSEPLIDKIGSGVSTPVPDQPDELIPVGFACREDEPSDSEICAMVDEVIGQVLGPQGLAAIVKPGDKVVIKVNNVGPYLGRKGEKGRGVITDPRIVRYVAEKVRAIIGFDGTADLKVVDTVFYADANPSLKTDKKSFYWARLERTGDNKVDPEDICYDGDGDGQLDGGSRAELVNLDALDASRRFLARVKVKESKDIPVCLPKFLRAREDAGNSNEYCDVLIGLPVFKSHGLAGVTGALKLHYGFRSAANIQGDTGRYSHSGLYWDLAGIHNKQKLLNFLCAEHQVRSYDLVIMDCLTGNRRGPLNPSSGTFSTVDNQPVDYILTNAVMASRDPVAIDTVETAFAGYEQDSVKLLATARSNGLGTDNPAYIGLCGWDSFGCHRQRLYDTYHPKDQYPFKDGWGEARILKSIQPLYTIIAEEPVRVKDGVYSFKYSIRSDGPETLTPVRVDLLVNGVRVACHNGRISNEGEFTVDLSAFAGSTLVYRAAVWDSVFNCSLSQEKRYHPVDSGR